MGSVVGTTEQAMKIPRPGVRDMWGCRFTECEHARVGIIENLVFGA